MHIDHSQVKYDAYQKHQVFELIDHMMDYYEGISDTSFSFIPNGTLTFGNYATYVYMSIRSTLDSIKMLLKAGHITDAFVLIRKLFDTVLVEIYLNVVREDQFDWLSFNFYLNGPYMMASDYMDYRDMNMEPPEGSESWIAPYAQEAFDEFIKPHQRLAEFIREHCCLDIA